MFGWGVVALVPVVLALLDVAENFFDEMGFGDIYDQPSCRLLYTGLIDGEGRCL